MTASTKDGPAFEDVELNAEPEPLKLQQSEAIMEAIIRSTKPLPIGPPDGQGLAPQRLNQFLQHLSDRLVPWGRLRWVFLFSLVAAFSARVSVMERHFFAAYVLAIYMLNQFLLFISPATEDESLPMGPTSGEYRPFARAISEFRFWIRGVFSTCTALTATLVDDLDLDVDPWALCLYFLLLFMYTMKQQIMHMYQYGYVPWSGPKKRGKVGKAKAEDALDV